ncbi:hypothetical protein Pmar_PMAR021388 [Perkinsus marinus ATCC 50983]|uniref:Uncharacterized protein n=1 Tax=Perkinsus marinus (strain ATCC 50983 / TXsc) TaxID=423536 RepID=C5KX57_PERM5|nr:hypothetical protein Pmar_PMAR021388 [Perkinsus marinus ATCC 50983]EER10913.1 hypothetical protein Pmar_PMAR021388 [Perkinsus marinus ATCC 50983]|eukprot:XP_002779118.1 hypothetical protein Pmar_PMAR021388 [Perkinsus marinus ATCC 50983]
MHLGLIRALLEKGDLVAYFDAFVKNVNSRGVTALSSSARWYKAVSGLLVDEGESIRAAVVQQGVEAVGRLMEHRGEGEVIERMMGAVLEGLRPLEHQVALVRQLVDDMSGTTCKPLAVALTATRQRLDGWKLPTEDVISDEKTVKLGHSVDSLLVEVLASLSSFRYDDKTMRKCLRKLQRHWETGTSELIWKNDLSPNIGAIVASAEEDTIMEIADIIVDHDLPFQWRAWPEALSLAVGQKVVQNGDNEKLVRKALSSAAGTSFVYLSLKQFAIEDLPEFILPLPGGRIELLNGLNREDMNSNSPIGPSLRWSQAQLSAVGDAVGSSVNVDAAAGACAFMLRADHKSCDAAKSLQRLLGAWESNPDAELRPFSEKA